VVRRGEAEETHVFVMNFTRAAATVELGSLAGLDLVSGRDVRGALALEPFGVAVIRPGAAARQGPGPNSSAPMRP